MNEKITLRELLGLMKPEKQERTPGKMQLQESSRMIADWKSGDTELSVYENGYAVLVDGKRWTVFPAWECYPYEYETNKDPEFITADMRRIEAAEFMDYPWTVRLLMEGEDRIETNNEWDFETLISEHPGYVEGIGWLRGWDPSPEDEYIKKETLNECLKAMTDKQREVALLKINGCNDFEIASILAVSMRAVLDRTQGGINRARRAL